MRKQYLFFIQKNQIATYYRQNSQFLYLPHNGEEFVPFTPDFLNQWKQDVKFFTGDKVDLAFLTDDPQLKITLPADLQQALVDNTAWTNNLILNFYQKCIQDIALSIQENGYDIVGTTKPQRTLYLTRFPGVKEPEKPLQTAAAPPRHPKGGREIKLTKRQLKIIKQ